MSLSPYILVILTSWVVAQGAKYIVAFVRNHKFDPLRQLYSSGNMPSAHSATVVSVAVLVGLREGFDSALFGVALALAGVVMYDSVMVRRSVGEQGKAVQELIKQTDKKGLIVLPRAAKGHTPLEVAVGAVLGLVIGYVVFIATI